MILPFLPSDLVVLAATLAPAYAQDTAGDAPEEPAEKAPVAPDRSTRLSAVGDYAVSGSITDGDPFSSAELEASPGFTVAASFGCSGGGCLGLALPIETVKALGTDLATGNSTPLAATTLAPALRLAYFATPAGTHGLGAAGYLDLGYLLSVGGSATVRGLYLGLNGDVDYFVGPHVAFAAGLGLSGSPYSVLHYPDVRVGIEYAY